MDNNKYNNSNGTEEEVILSKFLEKKYDKTYIDQWSGDLAKAGVIRTNAPNELSIIKGNFKFIWAAISLVVIGVLALLMLNFFQNKAGIEPTQYAFQLLQNDVHSILNNIKGVDAVKQQEYIKSAELAFNNRQWKEAQTAYAIVLKSQVSNDNHRFHLALSYLYDGQYQKANNQFSQLADKNLGDNRRQEVNWYYGLSLCISNNPVDAKVVLEQITHSQWKFNEAQELLKSMQEYPAL